VHEIERDMRAVNRALRGCMSSTTCVASHWVAGLSLDRKRRRQLKTVAQQSASEDGFNNEEVLVRRHGFRILAFPRAAGPWSDAVFVQATSPVRVAAALSATRPDVIVTNLSTALAVGGPLRERLGSDSAFRHVATIVMVPPRDSVAMRQCSALGATQCVSYVDDWIRVVERAYMLQEQRVRPGPGNTPSVCKLSLKFCVLFAL